MNRAAWLLGASGLIAGAGALYQAFAARRDACRFPPPGRMVDVGGFRLHLQVMGEANGGVTVVLDAGLDSFSTNWYWVQTALASEMRAIFALPRSSWTGTQTLSARDLLTRPRLNNARSLGDLPLAVVSVTEQPLAGRTLTALQNDLARLSSNAVHRIVTGATHEDLISKPEHAEKVADTIRDVVRAATTGTRLADSAQVGAA